MKEVKKKQPPKKKNQLKQQNKNKTKPKRLSDDSYFNGFLWMKNT